LLLEKIVNNVPEDNSDIQTIATTGGRFKALAVKIATEKEKVSPQIVNAVKQSKQGCIPHRDKYKCGLREIRELKGSFKTSSTLFCVR
jgi:hypothetical protein